MKMKRALAVLICMTLLITVVGCTNSDDTNGTNDADVGGDSDKEVISIGIAPYPQIDVLASILETGYEELGYPTERVEGDMGFMWLGVSQGDIDVFPDGWLPVLHQNYVEKYDGELEVGEVLYENASLGIAVPTYMEDINTIEDLKENADLVDNRIVGIEPSAGIMLTAVDTIEAYDMGDELDLLESSTAGMLGEVDSAISSEEPIAFLGWRPHTMFSKYDLKILEDSKDIWSSDDVHAVTALDFEERAPKAYEFTQDFEMTIADIEEILAESEDTGAPIEDIAKDWFENNREALDAVLD